ncbi:glycosyltransferase family 4 protein [Deinococcus alpinitundrae]|uniref:glycosyltransferase family 4 protein n=1 Tax=Deinococcus alpinitundrae TaxID=468913 RepID=UPI00137A784D|nr:glycosyltransferase family 4 protein [Deinococcus alpinitundrae]
MGVNKIKIITPFSDIESVPRMAKLLDALDALNVEVEHWCWLREQREQKYHSNNIHPRVLLVGGGYSNKTLILYYIIFFLKVTSALFSTKGERFYAIGFISSIPLALMSRSRKIEYIFDNNDNFSKSHKWPKPLKYIIECFENLIASRAKIHIVPSKFRWMKADKNLRFLPNLPTKKTVARAKELSRKENYDRDGKFTIYVNGLLTLPRGIDKIYHIAKYIDADKSRIIVAGKLISEEAREMVKLPSVEYLGELSNYESLAQYFRSNLVLTLYDPSIEINRLAEPNKWGDCIATSTPFLVNNEVQTAKEYIDSGICFSCPYENKSLLPLINTLIANPRLLTEAEEKMSAYNQLDWEDRMREILEEFFVDNSYV